MSETKVITPENLDIYDIARWKGPEMRQQMSKPSMREAIERVLSSHRLEEVQAIQQQVEQEQQVVPPQPTPEEIAAAEEQRKVEVAQQVEELARKAREEEEARKAAEPKKFVLNYQATDEEGNPIGRPTHLEASSQEELTEKLKQAHIQAVRAFHRVKKQKITVRQPEAPVEKGMSDAEIMSAIKDSRSDDPKVAIEAQRKLTKDEVDRQRVEEKKVLDEQQENLRQQQVSYQFLKNHVSDFNNCEANVKLIKDYFEQNQLDWTLDNLEAAFLSLESELAPVVKPVAPPGPANPAPTPAAPVAPTTAPAVPAVQPAAVPVVQSAPPAPAAPAAPANPAPAAPRPGVNGGLVPGQNSGVRPAQKSNDYTMPEIRSWSGEQMRAKMRNPQERAKIEKAIAAHNQAKTR